MQARGSAFYYQKQSVLPRPRANIRYGPRAGLVCVYGLTFNSPPPVIVFVDYELCMAKFQTTLLFSAYKYWLNIILTSEDKEEVI